MHGRVVARLALTPTLKDRTRRRKCFVFSLSIRFHSGEFRTRRFVTSFRIRFVLGGDLCASELRASRPSKVMERFACQYPKLAPRNLIRHSDSLCPIS